MKFGRAAAIKWIVLGCKFAIASLSRTREAYPIVPAHMGDDLGIGPWLTPKVTPELT
jgi:hypothetical protein